MSLMNWMLLLTLAAPPEGERIALTTGQLFIPKGLDAEAQAIDLWIHLHGTPTVTEPNFASRRSAVLVTITLPGLSSTYARHFKEPERFHKLLDEAKAILQKRKLPHRWRHVVVSSFSAGYGGVRELLKAPAIFRRIDVLVLSDTIYAGYSAGSLRDVQVEHMADFLRFARAAAAGEKHMLLTHCRLQPDGYAGTHETADYLMARLHGERETPKSPWPVEGMTLESRFTRKQLSVFSFAGTTGEDHMKHLRYIGELWNLVPE